MVAEQLICNVDCRGLVPARLEGARSKQPNAVFTAGDQQAAVVLEGGPLVCGEIDADRVGRGVRRELKVIFEAAFDAVEDKVDAGIQLGVADFAE